MSKSAAEIIAEAVGGEAIQGEDSLEGMPTWFVRVVRDDDRLVILSDKSVDEFSDHESADQGHCAMSISLV